LEEAGGYERLQQEYGYTHAEIAGAIGKSRSHVANMVRLFKLPEKSKKYLGEGKISAGHARALLALPNPDEIAERIVLEGLTVRDVERLSQPQPEALVTGGKASDRSSTPVEKDADTKALERRLSDALGLNVFIKSKGESGEIVVRYKNLEQLDDVCARLES
jgi:ParB family chromosome partitioning protein